MEIRREKRIGVSKREESKRGFVAPLSFLHLHNILVPDKQKSVVFGGEDEKEMVGDCSMIIFIYLFYKLYKHGEKAEGIVESAREEKGKDKAGRVCRRNHGKKMVFVSLLPLPTYEIRTYNFFPL